MICVEGHSSSMAHGINVEFQANYGTHAAYFWSNVAMSCLELKPPEVVGCGAIERTA
jgi:hypothetical protein